MAKTPFPSEDFGSRDFGSQAYESVDELERLIRGAGDYLEVSRDLRPRVIEEARTTQGERHARRWVGRAACLAATVAIVISLGSLRGDRSRVSQEPLAAASPQEFFERTQSHTMHSGVELPWSLVEVFSELRRQQAESLRPTPAAE